MLFYNKNIVDPIKNIINYATRCIPYEILQGSIYRNKIRFLLESQWWDKQKIEEYQNNQLQILLNYAYENVAYYKNLFHELGLRPKDIQSISELSKLPFLTKEMIVGKEKEFLNSKYKRSQLINTHTGGTTSSPLHFWYDRKMTSKVEKAFYWRMWQWHGYFPGDRCLILKGAFDLKEMIQYSPGENALYIFNPTFSIQTVKRYIKIIKQVKPTAIRGYPSLIYLLARFINEHNLRVTLPSLKAVFCSSEKILNFQKKAIAEAFDCKVVDCYGHNERVVAMQQCENLNNYHIIPEYGITEIIPDPIISSGALEKTVGEIVGTGFNNYAFPLIRYRTGDWAVSATSNDTCTCNRQFAQCKEIIGRTGDFVLTPKGNFISPTCIEFAVRYIHNYKDIQIIQKDIDLLSILLVPTDNYSADEGIEFAEGVCSRIGDGMKAVVKLVSKIERPSTQKSRFVVSEISKQLLSKHFNKVENV